MLRKLAALLGVALGSLWAQSVGDTIWVHLDDFRSMIIRQDTLWGAEVVATGEHIVVAKIDYRAFVNPLTGVDTDSVILTTDNTNLDSLAVALVNEFENTIRPGILDGFSITQDQLEDPNGDGKLLVVLAPLWTPTTSDEGNLEQGIVPVAGYFDPTDVSKDSLDMVVLNVDDSLLTNPSYSLNPSSTFQTRLCYFFARYVLWSVDPNEASGANTALAAYMTYQLYPDMLRGFRSGVQFGNFKSDFVYVNSTLYSYTSLYYNSPVAREQDRERGLVWMLYLAERFGQDFVNSLIHDTVYTVEQAVKNEAFAQGSNMPDEVAQFWLKVALHGHSNGLFDFSLIPQDSLFVPSKTSIPTSGSDEVLGMYSHAAILTKTTSLTEFLTFNGDDACKVTVGEVEMPGFRAYKFVFDDSFVLESLLVITPDSLNHFMVTDLRGGNTAIMVINVSDGAYELAWAPDSEPPLIRSILAIQNPVYTKNVDIYMFTPDSNSEQIYTDAGVADTFPLVQCTPQKAGYDTLYTNLAVLAMSDGEFWYYYGYTNMEITDNFGNIYSGVVRISPFRPMDQVGNIQTNVPYVDVSVLPLSSDGGTFTLVGDAVLEVPRGAAPDGTLLMASLLENPEAYFRGNAPERVYSIGTPSIPLEKPVKLSLPAQGSTGLYRWNGEVWEPVETWLSQDGTRLVAWVDQLGMFATCEVDAQQPTTLVVKAPTLFVSGQATLYLELPGDTRVGFEVYDFSGRLLRSEDMGVVPAGKRYIPLRIASGTGVYVYRLHLGDVTLVRKALVTR